MDDVINKKNGWLRWDRGISVLFGLVIILGGLVGFYVKTSASLPLGVVHSPQPIQMKHYFAPERLEAFSGNDFNLFPELVNLLDIFEQRLAAAPAAAPSYQDYIRFTNPAFVQFQIYTIQGHDNYWLLGKRHGYTIDTIVGCNPQLQKVVCYQGQKILMPSRGGSLHCVQPGENLNRIALTYGVEPESVLQANRISRKWGVIPNMWLFIPGAKPRNLSESMHKEYSKRSLFRSPLTGRYTSFVGIRIHPTLGFSKYHNGVDIACRQGTWVGSAASGVVEYAGWGGAIGQYIKIDHQNGYKTLYGHLSRTYVHTGQKVRGGQLIARSGSTGRSTGPHLHFTILDHGKVRNPMDFLW